MGQYWIRKNDKDDKDAETVANPWAERRVKGDRYYPDENKNSNV